MADKSISLEEIKNETVDLERIPVEEVFEQLKCTKEGLTSEEGANRLQIFGPNKLEEKKVATLLAVYANWGFARIKGVGWGWAGVIWLYSVVFYVPLDFIKFAVRYILSGKAWDTLIERRTAFSNKKDYGREEREAQWALAQRTLHGLHPPETSTLFSDKSSYRELSEIAEQAKRRAEVARLRELNTLKGHVESVVKLKGLDIDNIQQHYTV
ncbi:hypothetical protein MRB53_008857 [Persea americana]|uniref:Uncharacterized protein n=1 Tax=Persea americana TaxID=3435 RepID=A0ACC2LMB6_PERAE|nr:hypothetical protein MRB53_008857 [Persea americana]